MAKKFYFTSGHSSSGELVDIDGRALGEADNKDVLVLNMSSDNRDKNMAKREFFRGYFGRMGANDVNFVDKGTPGGKIDDEFDRAGLVYIPGGDTRVLIRNLKERALDRKLENFDGVILGNSAGAYALCPDYLRVGHGVTEIIPSLGLVNFWVKAHYKSDFDGELRWLSVNRDIYALKDVSAIMFNRKGWDENFDFIGDVWRFSEGKGKRCHLEEGD